MIIAVDFDGTIVEHKYPEIGKPIPFAIETLLMLQQERHLLILWTVREGRLLQEAIDFCADRGLYFYAVNANYPEEDKSNTPRKLNAELFIDDRNLGGLPDWGVIYNTIQLMTGRSRTEQTSIAGESEKKRKKRFLFPFGRRVSGK